MHHTLSLSGWGGVWMGWDMDGVGYGWGRVWMGWGMDGVGYGWGGVWMGWCMAPAPPPTSAPTFWRSLWLRLRLRLLLKLRQLRRRRLLLLLLRLRRRRRRRHGLLLLLLQRLPVRQRLLLHLLLHLHAPLRLQQKLLSHLHLLLHLHRLLHLPLYLRPHLLSAPVALAHRKAGTPHILGPSNSLLPSSHQAVPGTASVSTPRPSPPSERLKLSFLATISTPQAPRLKLEACRKAPTLVPGFTRDYGNYKS